jgi:DNA-binding MurR/RpiR family transcriptional regulator
MTTLETRFAEAEPNRSTSRKRLIREILDHPEDTCFLSSRALAKRYELDPTTIVRTVQALGCKRYSEFSADLRSHFVTRITPYAVMKSAVRDKRVGPSSVDENILHSCSKRTFTWRNEVKGVSVFNIVVARLRKP